MPITRTQLIDIARQLSVTENAGRFDCQMLPGDVEVLQVIVNDLEEFPIYLSETSSQLLFITYLWRESDINKERRTDMLEAMLDLNIPIPLSSFSRIAEHYVLFGAARRDASLDAVVVELDTLAENAIDALEAMQEFLI